jgi:hypothetical protein
MYEEYDEISLSVAYENAYDKALIRSLKYWNPFGKVILFLVKVNIV